MKNIPTRLQSAREKAGITISKMAAITGTSRSHIYSIEEYTGLPPKIDLLDVADYSSITNTPLPWLLLGIDTSRTTQLIDARMSELLDVINRAAQVTKSEILKASSCPPKSTPKK
jgi:transcriptional regulator with XRE-family HTH domain